MSGLSLADKVTLGAALLGGMAGATGSFAVLRSRSLVGDMLAHTALPGVVLAFMLTQSRTMATLSLGALVSGLLAIALMTLITRWTRTKEDAAIGIMLSTFFGLGVVLLSLVQTSESSGNKSGLDTFLFGEAGSMLDSDLVTLSIVAAAVTLLLGLLFKEFKLAAFDADFAAAQGWPTGRLDFAMMAAVAVVTIVGLPVVGVILMAALIILPGVTARMWTNRLHWMLILAAGFGVTAGVLGTRLGYGYPAGPVIVLTAAVLFGFSLLFAPERGIAARLWSETRLRFRVANDHLLRSLYELVEPQLPNPQAVPLSQLREHRYVQAWLLRWLLERGEDRGLFYEADDAIQLTPLGTRRAAEVVKTHRLWELYMLEYAGVAAHQADRAADAVEHMLPESLLVELEARLAAEGRLPKTVGEMPESPHELGDHLSPKIAEDPS